MTSPWVSGRKIWWFLLLWTPGSWHILRAPHMLGDWTVIRFSGWEQTFEDMESIPSLIWISKGWPHYTCSEIFVALSTGEVPSCLCCSFLHKLFLLLEGRLLAPISFLPIHLSSFTSEVFPDPLIWGSSTLVSVVFAQTAKVPVALLCWMVSWLDSRECFEGRSCVSSPLYIQHPT